MGTMFYHDELLPTGEYDAPASDKRQVEVFRPSGTSDILLRIGEIGDVHMGRGASVVLDEKSAVALIDGIETAFLCTGRKLPGRG